MRPPCVIILNGVGSVGKSSTARALQGIVSTPLLHVSMDAFIEMLPARMFGHPDGLVFATRPGGDAPCIEITSGPIMARTMRAMRHAVAAMASQGSSLIVDDIIMAPNEIDEYRSLLSRFRLHLVGLLAPLATLEARERARGDRQIGLARWQYARVHRGLTYDLQVDTAQATPSEVAETIRAAFDLPKLPGDVIEPPACGTPPAAIEGRLQ